MSLNINAIRRILRFKMVIFSEDTYSYLSTGPSATKQQPNGDVISYTYDALDRLVTTVYADSTRVTLAYDAVGRTTTMADSTGTATYVYDAANRLTDKTDPGALRQQYSYDAVGNRTRLVEPNGNVRTFTYDSMDRVSVFIDPEAKKTTLQYDAVGRNTTILFQSGLRFLNGFDAAGQQTLSRADYGGDPSLKSNFFYSYDGVGNRTGYTDTVFDSVQTMTYDAKNRLTRWQGNVISAKDYAYTYDEIDNRLTDTETGVVRTWTYDASSRLTTMTNGSVTTTFTFDTNGNNSGVNEGGALTTMSYDKENRMVSYADGSGTTASVYNGIGQKVKQGATTLVWDGWDYLGEVNSGAFDCETFTVNSQILAEKKTGTERLDFERTALGSVCTKYDQTNQARAGVQRYKPYGSLEFHDSTLPTWQWVGSRGYRPTGLSWSDYYVRARHYGTQQAQWTTVDPLWPEELQYGYVANSPMGYTDYFGEYKIDKDKKCGATKVILITPESNDFGTVVGPNGGVGGGTGKGTLPGSDCTKGFTNSKGKKCICVNGSFYGPGIYSGNGDPNPSGYFPVGDVKYCNHRVHLDSSTTSPKSMPKVKIGTEFISGFSIDQFLDERNGVPGGNVGRTGVCVDKNGHIKLILVVPHQSGMDKWHFVSCLKSKCPKNTVPVFLDGGGSSQIWEQPKGAPVPKPIIGGRGDGRWTANWIVLCEK